MIREIINRFNRSLTERLVASRRRYTAPIRVWFEPELNLPLEHEMARNMAIPGETVDMSRTGIAFLVNSIRIKEKYLVGQERRLNVEIDLPSGKVHLQLAGRRYEKAGTEFPSHEYLVGAHILKIDPDSNAAYDHFLRYGAKRSFTAATASLELGVDR